MQSSSVTLSTDGTANAANSTWSRTMFLLVFVLAGTFGAFCETASSIFSIWLRSDTFAHGFLIAPISIWLVWEKRTQLSLMNPQPAVAPLVLMLPLGFGWLLAYLVDVLVVQQFAFVGLLILAIWSVLGTPIARYLAFPLGFLLLGVPVGEGLIYPMMNFTADFTVGMLRLTGIPVFRDGTFFSIPSGDWSVVEACSGVRYLIATVTLGVLYAHLTYTKAWKRIVFVGVSVVVPILANGLRAYLIVMIGHVIGMEHAVGASHIIYGWVFFGIVITTLFFIGAFWRDPSNAGPQVPAVASAGGPASGALIVALAAVMSTGLWPGLAWVLEREYKDSSEVRLQAPAPAAGWRLVSESSWDWRPNVVGAGGEQYSFYLSEKGTPVGLYLGVYRTQRQGAELLSSQNQMVVQEHPVWNDKEQTTRRIRLQAEDGEVNQSRLASNRQQRLLVWSWYRIGGQLTANPYLGKMLEVLSRLLAQRRDGALIAIAAPYEDKVEEAEEVLQAFVNQMLPSVDQELNRALQQSP